MSKDEEIVAEFETVIATDENTTPEEIAEKVMDRIREALPEGVDVPQVRVRAMRIPVPDGFSPEDLSNPDKLMELLANVMGAPKPDPIIQAVLDEFSALSESDDEAVMGTRAQEILGTKSREVPVALQNIMHHFIPAKNFGKLYLKPEYKDLDMEGELPADTDPENVWDMDAYERDMGQIFRALLTALVAGYQFAKKGGAAPIMNMGEV